jgi:hypothetical protein
MGWYGVTAMAILDCLPHEIRVTCLDESEFEVQSRYEACKRSPVAFP